jgi:hypothetical protein
LQAIFDALTADDIGAEAVVYSDGAASEIRDQLLRLSGVLVWVDPITRWQDRSTLDALLRDVSAKRELRLSLSGHGADAVVVRRRELRA